VALLSETHLKLHDRFCIPNYQVYWTDHNPGLKGGTTVAVRKSIPLTRVDLHLLVWTETTGACLPIGNRELLFSALYKIPVRAWSDTDVIGLFNFRHKSLLEYDMNAKSPVLNSWVSNSLM
jgi:hypothetical protein